MELTVTTDQEEALEAFAHHYQDVVADTLDMLVQEKMPYALIPSVRSDVYYKLKETGKVVLQSAHIQTAIGMASMLRHAGLRTIQDARRGLAVTLRKDTYGFTFDNGIVSMSMATYDRDNTEGRLSLCTNLVLVLPPRHRFIKLWKELDEWHLLLE